MSEQGAARMNRKGAVQSLTYYWDIGTLEWTVGTQPGGATGGLVQQGGVDGTAAPWWVDLRRIAGNTVDSNVGAPSAGSQRVVIAANPVPASAETSSIYNSGTALTPKFATIAASSNGANSLVAAVGGKKIRVLAYNFISNGTVNAKFQSDAAGTPVDLTGNKYCVANMGIAATFVPVGWFESGSGKTLDLFLSAGVAVGGELVYVEV